VKKKAVGFQRNKTTSDSFSETLSEQAGESVTQTELNASLELLDHSLKESVNLLRTGVGTGAFFASAMIYAADPDLGRRIGTSLAATLSGSKTHLRPFQVIPYSGPGSGAHLTHQVAAHTWFPGLAILSNHLAAQMLLTPEAELPGLRMKRNVFYGRHEPGKRNGQCAWLGDVSFLRSGVRLRDEPRRAGGSAESPQFEIPSEDLLSHVLVTGTTGSGKTLRAVAILNRIDPAEFQIVVLESAKKTFRKLLNRHGVKRRVFTVGESRENPLRVNPFFFEPNTSLKRHVSVLSDALSDLLPVEALIGPKLREAIQSAYREFGWDLETGRHTGSGPARYPSVLDLNLHVLRVAKGLRYSPELKANYLGALTGRSQLFIDDLYQDIFAWNGDRTLEELFGEDDAIIEMDALPPSEIQMPAFVLSLLLERFRARQALGGKRKLLLVLEEAHNFLDRGREQGQSGREIGSGGHLLQQIVRLLQEGRELGLGVMVIDQSPSALADAVIKNTNTKLVLRISDSEEARLIGSGLGLGDDEWRDLHELEDGECIVKTKNAGKAVKLAPLSIPLEPRSQPPPVPISAPPDYARARSVLRRLLKSGAETNWQASADELLRACCGNLALMHYVARKFRFEQLAETDAAEWRDLPAPAALAEVPLLLKSLAGNDDELSRQRTDFARSLAKVINGHDEVTSPGRDSCWFGSVEALVEILRGSEGWEDEGALDRFRGDILQWLVLDPSNPGLAFLRGQLRLMATVTEGRRSGLEAALTQLCGENVKD
jgi:hypothetical protein